MRTAIFDEVRKLARPGIFADPANILALDNLLDSFGVPRDKANHELTAPDRFFAGLREVTGGLTQGQVDIVNMVLKEATQWPVGWVAYALATAWHEARFVPQAEWGKGKGRPYAVAGKYGQPQYGRGLVQLTWDRNYEWADKALGLNGALLNNFDLALDPKVSVDILLEGMRVGAFTGARLGSCITGTGSLDDFVAARKIVNGTDKAELIAGYAMKFQEALKEGGW